MQTFCQLPRPLEIGKTLAYWRSPRPTIRKTLAQLLEKPLPNYWRSPRPTIGEALAQLLEKPSPNYWKNPCPTIGEALAQLLEKPLPNYWRSHRPTIGEALAQLLEKPNYWQLQQLKMPKNFCWARKRPSPTNVTIKL